MSESEPSTDLTLRLERHLDAPPERVWRAVATQELNEWYWPASLAPQITIDARPGGAVSLRSDPGDLSITGTVTVADAPHRLAHTWQWAGDDHASLVTVTLTPAGDGTDLVVEHTGMRSAQEVANHTGGWTSCLDRLPAQVSVDP